MIIKLIDVVLFSTYFLLMFFSIFWLLVLFTSSEEKKKRKLLNYPFFTTIVPAYNEEAGIIKTLNSLINLDYPKEKKEIIVVNDGSTDKTKNLVEMFIKKHPKEQITLLNQHNQGKGRAMNNGLQQAKGDFFACLDADSFVAKNALQEMLPYFQEDENVAAVCPLLKVQKPTNVLQKVQWFEYIINMFYKSLNAKIDCIHVTPGPFSVYRTKVVKELGGFNEQTITEDLEIAIRLQKHQYKIVQTFDTTVETVTPQTWRALFWQRIRWYKGSWDNTVAYKNLMFNKKYGDFGYLRMPTVVLSGFIAIILFFTLIQDFFTKAWQSYHSLQAVNFDLLTLIKNYSFQLNLLNWPLGKFMIAGTLMAISLFIMFYSYYLVKEKITNNGKTFSGMITYLFIYGLFMTAVWMYIAYLVVSGKKNRW